MRFNERYLRIYKEYPQQFPSGMHKNANGGLCRWTASSNADSHLNSGRLSLATRLRQVFRNENIFLR